MALSFPQIDPVALSIGPLDIRWYSLAYLAGFLLGWKLAQNYCGLSPKKRPTKDDIDNFLPFAILGVILGGRLGYILFYQPALYLENPLGIFKVWEGGMAFHGGATGVIIALILFAWHQKIQLLRLSDIVCAVVPIGLFFGRLANFVNGELYGRTTDVAWGVVFPYGGPEPRHPSQIYEALLEGALLFVILLLFMKNSIVRERPGIVTGSFLAGYGVFRMSIEQFRQPDAHLGFVIGVFSMGQLLSVPMVVVGLGVIIYSVTKHRKAA